MDNLPPLISVLVPVYNAEPFFRQCIDSILSQQWTDFELILIDDGSTDKSAAICDEYAMRDHRVQVRHIPNSGVYPARNLGLRMARGEFVLLVDADDFIEPHALTVLLETQRRTGADFVQGGFRFFIDDGVSTNYMGETGRFLPPKKGLAYIEKRDGKPHVCFLGSPCAFLLRLAWAKRHNLSFREDMLAGADAMFILRTARLKPVYEYVDMPLYNYRRQTVNSITSTYSSTKRERTEAAFRWLDDLRLYLLGSNPTESVNAALGDAYINFMIRYLVVCAADSLIGSRSEAFEYFCRMAHSPLWKEMLPHYNPEAKKGKSRLLPWLVQRGWLRSAFHLCRMKAKKRYQRELHRLAVR